MMPRHTDNRTVGSNGGVSPLATVGAGLTFSLTTRQPIRPVAVVLAIVLAGAALGGVLFGLRHGGRAALGRHGSDASSGAGPSAGGRGATGEDKDDDPNQVDTIVLGDPSEAPAPARKGDHVSPVHATIVVRLPRFGDQVGLIPDGAPGRLLYAWLAAFNRGDEAGLGRALPTRAGEAIVGTEMQLRRETGGLALLSAKEVEPGVLVFRLRD